MSYTCVCADWLKFTRKKIVFTSYTYIINPIRYMTWLFIVIVYRVYEQCCTSQFEGISINIIIQTWQVEEITNWRRSNIRRVHPPLQPSPRQSARRNKYHSLNTAGRGDYELEKVEYSSCGSDDQSLQPNPRQSARRNDVHLPSATWADPALVQGGVTNGALHIYIIILFYIFVIFVI